MEFGEDLFNYLNLKRIEETKVRGNEGKILGYHSVVIDSNEYPIGGGLSYSRNESRRIALAEALERFEVERLKGADKGTQHDWGLGFSRTTSGFAAGFDKESTQFRAFCEGLERWAWSKWIDEGFIIPVVNPGYINPLTESLLEPFDEINFFEMEFPKIEKVRSNLKINIILAESDRGVYPGSRVTSWSDDGWQHSAIEVRRHFEVSKKIPGERNIYYDRIEYFSANKSEAFDQVRRANLKEWPVPEIYIRKIMQLPHGYLARTLFENYVPWSLGDKYRFVY